jgi:hypothetical protein
MPPPFANHAGKVFSSWTVKSFYGRTKSNAAVWLCVCKCGKEKPVIMGSLQKGQSKSCGCEGLKARVLKNTKHGMAGTKTYKSWHQMHQRCLGKNGHDYYLSSGISVCDRWKSFELFFADMGLRPDGLTLDRIDGSKGYEPGNCRWASAIEQANNKKTNVKQIVFGEEITPAQAARKYGMHISGVRHRLRKGMSLEQAVSVPMGASKIHEKRLDAQGVFHKVPA